MSQVLHGLQNNQVGSKGVNIQVLVGSQPDQTPFPHRHAALTAGNWVTRRRACVLSPRWKRLQGAWAWPWPRLGSRMETQHDSPRSGCPVGGPVPMLSGRQQSNLQGRSPGLGYSLPQPAAPHRASAEPTSAGQPARRTVLGGSRRWCWPAACRTSLEGEGQRSACSRVGDTPWVCTPDSEVLRLHR